MHTQAGKYLAPRLWPASDTYFYSKVKRRRGHARRFRNTGVLRRIMHSPSLGGAHPWAAALQAPRTYLPLHLGIHGKKQPGGVLSMMPVWVMALSRARRAPVLQGAALAGQGQGQGSARPPSQRVVLLHCALHVAPRAAALRGTLRYCGRQRLPGEPLQPRASQPPPSAAWLRGPWSMPRKGGGAGGDSSPWRPAPTPAPPRP